MMYKQCTICRRKIKMNEKCECQVKDKKQNRNQWQKQYNEENKEDLKLIKNVRWYKLRKIIIERDGGYCQRCFHKFNVFNSDDLQVHHIKPRIDYPELVYDDKNLVTVCGKCNLQLGTTGRLDFNFTIKDTDYHIK